MMQKEYYHYNRRLKPFAGEHRKNPTLSEAIVWKELLRSRNLKGYQFFRQKPIDSFIVDFFCKELKLVIELDGISHYHNTESDRIRQRKHECLGYNVLRFDDIEVTDLQTVKSILEMWVEDYESKNPEVLKFKVRRKFK